MKNKNILYGLLGAGALAGFYFWNKNQKPKTYSKECRMKYSLELRPEVVMPPEYWEKREKDFLENCAKNEKK